MGIVNSELIVEGSTDKDVFDKILARANLNHTVPVVDGKGYQNLVKGLPLRLKPGTDIERLGIVVDADVDVVGRWQSVTSALRRSGFSQIPRSPDPTGTVLEESGLPRVGIWVMPNNSIPGMLEDYLGYLVPDKDLLYPHAAKAVDALPETEQKFRDIHKTKALIHTWLAWQKEPGTPLGLAVVRQYLRLDNPHGQNLIDWLRRVFCVDAER